jgi:hypothetical protein
VYIYTTISFICQIWGKYFDMFAMVGERGLGHRFSPTGERHCSLHSQPVDPGSLPSQLRLSRPSLIKQKKPAIPTDFRSFFVWWAREDSNLQAFRHMVLSHTRMPVPPLAQKWVTTSFYQYKSSCKHRAYLYLKLKDIHCKLQENLY